MMTQVIPGAPDPTTLKKFGPCLPKDGGCGNAFKGTWDGEKWLCRSCRGLGAEPGPAPFHKAGCGVYSGGECSHVGCGIPETSATPAPVVAEVAEPLLSEKVLPLTETTTPPFITLPDTKVLAESIKGDEGMPLKTICVSLSNAFRENGDDELADWFLELRERLS